MTYEETLTEHGWTFTDSCNCGGTLKRNYKNPDFFGKTVTIQPMRQNFMIKQGNTIESINPLSKLTEILEEL